MALYMKPFLGYFHRSESRKLAECYVAGLLMDGERKSVEPMSEKVNGRHPAYHLHDGNPFGFR